MAGQPVIAGIVLAAGQGRRYGSPKAFERTDSGATWVSRAVDSLAGAGCRPIIVTLPRLTDLALPDFATPVVVPSGGQAASLKAALAATPEEATAVMITLVDLPDVDASVVQRVLDVAGPVTPAALARAGFRGEPGHPVLIGRAHLGALQPTLAGDRGARSYLESHRAQTIECGDLATGADVDVRSPG